MKIKKCSNCSNNIRIHTVKFPVINDFGGIIVKCDNCDFISFLATINPDELSISLGATKIDTWDNFATNKEDFLTKYPNANELELGVEVIGDYQSREYTFDFNSPHLYHCEKCNKEVETALENQLKLKSSKITESFNNLMNFILANDAWERENLVIEIQSKCDCGNQFISYWYYKYILNGEPIDFEKVCLIGTNMSMLSEKIDGISSKNDCIKLLEKLIIRWNAIYPRLLIVTPFVGHQWMSKLELIELWDWLKNYVDPTKTTLVTRTATFNKYKKACEEKGISLDLLNDYGLNNPVIKDFTRKQDFHAKIYFGYSENNAELLTGSFNLLKGPSMENISFKSLNYKNLLDKYLDPMNIKISSPEKLEKRWSHIKEKGNNEWISLDIESKEILDMIMKYE